MTSSMLPDHVCRNLLRKPVLVGFHGATVHGAQHDVLGDVGEHALWQDRWTALWRAHLVLKKGEGESPHASPIKACPQGGQEGHCPSGTVVRCGTTTFL